MPSPLTEPTSALDQIDRVADLPHRPRALLAVESGRVRLWSNAMLSKDDIIRALESLNVRLGELDEHADLLVVGGAAIVLLFGSRPSTHDIDAIRVDGGDADRLRAASQAVALDMNFPLDWLNDAAKGYVHQVDPGAELFRGTHLRVRAATVEQLFAMKLSAWRDDLDIADAALLLAQLAGTHDECWSRVRRFIVPGRELKAQLAFEDLWESAHEGE